MRATDGFKVVGTPVPRVEGFDKVRGRAIYSADVWLPNTIWAVNVRSPLPHARIVAIHTSAARAVPGVLAVLTAADIPPGLIGRGLKDHPILCRDRVRFIGDKVAVVAAVEREVAEEAALLVEVEYEELPAVLDPIEGMSPGSPLIHPDARGYIGYPPYIPEDIPNVCAYRVVDHGNVQEGFAQADIVVEHTFRTQVVHQAYLEPHASVVATQPGPDGDSSIRARVEIWTSNKAPFELREELAQILAVPAEDIVVHCANIGGDFGSKCAPADVPVAYCLARMLSRPVKMITSSHDDLIATNPRSASVITLRTGLTRNGKILARDARIVFDTGAYGAFRPNVFDGMLGGAHEAAGSYEVPNLHIEARMVYTNTVPRGYMRAPGQPQVIFAVEAHMDLLARELGIDPLEFRRRNIVRDAPNGESSVVPDLLERAAGAIGWDTPHRSSGLNRATGRGLAIAARGTGVGTGSSEIIVNSDGTITVVTAMPDNGAGGLTVVVQVAAEIWGVPLERVRLVHADTDAFAVDVEAGASRMTNVAGHAVIAASQQVQQQLAPLAASLVQADEAKWDQGGWRADNGRWISLEDVAKAVVTDNLPSARARVTITTPRSSDRGYCVQAAQVEVDLETGHVRLQKLASVQDVGTIINTIGHQGQIEGAVVQGVGFALTEDLGVEDGVVTNGYLGDYKIPSIRDVPELITINVPTSGPGPFNAKGVGETSAVPGPGAIANAVADAIGAAILELPVTPERVLAAIEVVSLSRRQRVNPNTP